MPNITIHLDPETHRLAKIYSATTGKSVSGIFRDHIRALAGEMGSAPQLGPLERYAKGEISAAEAMSALELPCLEDLYQQVAAHGVPLPHIDWEGASAMAKPVAALVRSSASRTRARA